MKGAKHRRVHTVISFTWSTKTGKPNLCFEAEGHGNPLQYSCLEYPMDRAAWRARVHRVAKSWTWLKWCSGHTCIPWKARYVIRASLVAQMVKRLPTMWETWVWSLGREDPLEKEMAPHSSTLAWKIPWMEELCRLQSMGSQRLLLGQRAVSGEELLGCC